MKEDKYNNVNKKHSILNFAYKNSEKIVLNLIDSEINKINTNTNLNLNLNDYSNLS